jgi:hypothetical protein
MARSSSGRTVARAAATGGGTTYRGQMPVNWYAALIVIVLLGVGSVAFARYNYGKSVASTQPVVGQTWHAAVAFDICGTIESNLAASPQSSTTGLTTTGSGLLLIAPKSSSEAGNNATLGKFASEYTGLTLTNTSIKLPTGSLLAKGDTCAKGTPDAGKVGVLKARSWVISTKSGKNGQVLETGGKVVSDPADLKLLNRQLITVGFVPSSTTLPKPSGTITVALLQAVEGTAPVTSTTTPATVPTSTTTPTTSTTSTTGGSTTSTTAPSSTTTSTTAASTTTTTTKK